MQFLRFLVKKINIRLFVYALSTCVWCKLTKQYLNDNNVEYEYVDVDLADEKDKQKIHEKIHKQRRHAQLPHHDCR